VQPGWSRLTQVYHTGTCVPAKQVHTMQATAFSEGHNSFCGSIGSFYAFLGEIDVIIHIYFKG